MSGYSAKVIKLQQENKQLRKALEIKHYCKYANKCNEVYDCTREEYNSMAECNMKLSLENDELQQENKQLKKKYENAVADYELEKYKNSKAREYIKLASNKFEYLDTEETKELLEILGDKEYECKRNV